MENTEEFVAEHALIIYRCKENNNGFDEGQSPRPLSHYITQHRISTTGELLEGMPLTRETLSEICSLVVPGIRNVDYLPPEVIAYSPGHALLWWVPAGVKTLFFKGDTGIKSGRHPVPASLLLVLNGNLHTWALATNKRPSPDTELFHSPFFNVYSEGNCCMGNIHLPQSFSPHDIKAWEDTFFGGLLSSDLPPQLNGCTPKKLWTSIYQKKQFPVKYLVHHQSKTVSDVIQAIERRHQWI
jgi:PRTRC genetic system protein B